MWRSPMQRYGLRLESSALSPQVIDAGPVVHPTPVRRLRFDTRPVFGNPQHYFHFMWGYLMPALDRALLAPEAEGSYELDSCGPAMDPRIAEVVDWLGAPFRIGASGDADAAGRLAVEEWVPRWDAWLRGRNSLRLRAKLRLHRLGLEQPVVAGIERVARHLVAAATARSADASPPDAESEWLLLARSEEPSFYRPDGPATKKGYGLSRRGIANLEALATGLREAGLPVRIYEPGRDPLARQVAAFHRAAGVVAIRGAELANVAWMRPGTSVVMLVTPVERENNVSAHLALCRGLRVYRLPVDTDFPVVPADRIILALSRGAASPAAFASQSRGRRNG